MKWKFLSPVWLFVTPWTAAGQVSLSFTISWNLLKFMSIESVMSSNHLILRYADDTTLMAESEEELKSLLMKVKEEIEKLA